MKVLIVGGVAGGASAATRLRRQSEDAQIILFEKGEYISYANCGLPYYIGGTIRDRERLIVTTPQLLRDRFRIDVRTMSEVVKIDRAKKMVTVKNHADGTVYEESYDKLILSPGAQPKRPPLPGIDSEGIFTLRTVPDTYRIDEYIRETKAESAVVVGAGFIGVEMAENLKKRGLDVTIVEYLDQAIASLDPEMAAILHRHLRENGIRLLFGTGVQGFEKAENLKVKLTGEKEICADLVVLSIGVAPDSSLAKDAGLELSVGGSIQVNDTLQTSDPDIYAVGDAISVRQFLTGEDTLVPLAGPANRQGRLAGENVLGRRVGINDGVQGSAILKVFDMTAASTGMNEKQLKAKKIPYQRTYIHPADHATYYPGSSQISMKLLFAPDGKILGAQVVGFDGVDKRIDVLATALRFGGTVYDLEKLELCYAPPYSSAKDPVNILGFTAANILRGDVKVFYFDEVDALDRSKVSLVDTRTPSEVQAGTIDGAINIPLDQLRERMQELPKEKPVYVFCQVGLRGYLAARILMQNGYDVKNLSGGYKTYITAKGDREQPTGTDCIGCKKKLTEPVAPACGKDVKIIEVDACGLQCPGPIMKVSEGIKSIREGECLKVRATDPAFASDIRIWCERTGNPLLGVEREGSTYSVTIRKGDAAPAASAAGGNGKSMVVFSGDLDKALAALIIANGAASMGRKVTLFFTFWGLNILRKNEYVPVKKNFIEKMFGMMMPRGSKKLGLSKMNMLGMGPKMIRSVMKSKNVSSLEELLRSAIDNGVRIVACQMSMDIMGIKREELIDGVEIAGVATFLGSAEQSDTNLFI
ncbi:pyridine nucleotide-disulfide oxidoreductase [Caproiciproducens galactitolivorans]|uniref:Coenzyme A disulfide reductase n=1 Tax=Caproiciproducens galactitolivorans TaxID=642589 RepID=A0A4Z0YF07_9FIRM|nr:FAD-dependent oxidoreductase [Caproiciproducens galactitolivorans]QEY34977.1 pyridine nucleotide-disulfide oxidoreductase [Caproiciproducens galactitolivorans]TGJ76316.1 coenzyme A disulfide reductase [Caproiciproducens galactitolivorans]